MRKFILVVLLFWVGIVKAQDCPLDLDCAKAGKGDIILKPTIPNFFKLTSVGFEGLEKILEKYGYFFNTETGFFEHNLLEKRILISFKNGTMVVLFLWKGFYLDISDLQMELEENFVFQGTGEELGYFSKYYSLTKESMTLKIVVGENIQKEKSVLIFFSPSE